MTYAKSLKIPVIQPLFYGTRPVDSKIFIPPSSYAIGAFYIAPEREKYHMIDEWLENNRKKQREGGIDPEVSPLLSYNSRELGELIKNKIKEEKGTQKLWRADDVITGGKLRHNVLTSRVESRRSGREKKILKNWLVTVKTPFYRDGFGVDYSDVSCQDDMYQIVKGKGYELFCVHMGALAQRAHKEYPMLPADERLIGFEDAAGIPYIPYLLKPEKIISVVVNRYLLKKRYYDIDRELSDDPEIYDPLYLEAIKKSNIIFENIQRSYTKRRAPIKKVTKSDEQALWYVKNIIEKNLTDAGFKKTGIALELKGTRFEALCINYEKDNRVVRLLIPDLRVIPPLLFYREINHRNYVDIFYKNDQKNPLAGVYDEYFTVDDRTRLVTKTKIIIPHSPKSIPELPELIKKPIVENFKDRYATLIKRNYPGNKKGLLKELGLL
jgi:hypothetical protein